VVLSPQHPFFASRALFLRCAPDMFFLEGDARHFCPIECASRRYAPRTFAFGPECRFAFPPNRVTSPASHFTQIRCNAWLVVVRRGLSSFGIRCANSEEER